MRTSRLVLFPLVALWISGCEQSLGEATGPQDQPAVSGASASNSAGTASGRAENRPFWATNGNANTHPATDFLGTTDDQPLVFKTNGAEVMRVNTDGNTGIGTSSPEQLLHLVGGDDPTLRIQSDGDNEPSGRLSLRQGNGNGMDIFYDGSSGIDGLKFDRFSGGGTNAWTRMIIKHVSGNVGIGTTNPRDVLHLFRGSPSTVGVLMGNSHTGGGRAGFLIDYHGSNGAELWNFENTDMWFGTNNRRRMTIENDGNVGIGTSNPAEQLHVIGNALADAYLTPSSRRWKENIAPIEGALDKVQRLRGVSYDWKADGRHDIGLIAEEVGEVIPGVVAYEANAVDARSVDYARLVAVLIEAIKEQQQQIEALQAVVTLLVAER
jgi:hypothetical protein